MSDTIYTMKYNIIKLVILDTVSAGMGFCPTFTAMIPEGCSRLKNILAIILKLMMIRMTFMLPAVEEAQPPINKSRKSSA